MLRCKFLIIGMGPTGLGAACRLLELNEGDFLMLETERHAGGLAASFCDENGFTWDLGSHVQHSHYEKFDQYMDLALPEEDWLYHQRSTWIWHDGRFVDYPFQLNLHQLSKEDQWRCVEGLLKRAADVPNSPKTFSEWIQTRFGEGIAELFMRPYNEKVWARSLHELGCMWVNDRVAPASLEQILRGIILEKGDGTWGANARFRYPRRGGTGIIWQRIASSIPAEKVHFAQAVKKVDRRKSAVWCGSGREYAYEYLISTMPLECLAERCEPNVDLSDVKHLRKNTTSVFGFGFEGKLPGVLNGRYWGYYAQRDVPFYRVTIMSNLSPGNVPRPAEQWSLMAEVAESEVKSQEGIKSEWVLQSLSDQGLINRDSRVVGAWHRRLRHGYPVPTVGRDQSLQNTFNALEKDNVFSRGRFGAWKYEVSNQDHSFMQGIEVVDRIVLNREELTLNYPQIVNARLNPFPYPEWCNGQTANR